MIKISPVVNIAFKKLFGVGGNKDLLISLINSIVGQEDQVSDIQILNPYNLQEYKHDKMSILDVKAKSLEGMMFNIEIQVIDEGDYDKRALYYWAKLYSGQLQESYEYDTLSKAIGIHILNFISIPELNNYHNVFRITEKESGKEYFKDLELHTIELNKFCKKEGLQQTLNKIKSSLGRWTTFLTQYKLLNSESLPKELNKQELKKAVKVLEVMNFDELEIEIYEAHLKWLRTEASGLKKAEEKGREKGKKEGIKEGIEKGKEETAKKMLAKGLDLRLIEELTGLSKQTIENLLKK